MSQQFCYQNQTKEACGAHPECRWIFSAPSNRWWCSKHDGRTTAHLQNPGLRKFYPVAKPRPIVVVQPRPTDGSGILHATTQHQRGPAAAAAAAASPQAQPAQLARAETLLQSIGNFLTGSSSSSSSSGTSPQQQQPPLQPQPQPQQQPVHAQAIPQSYAAPTPFWDGRVPATNNGFWYGSGYRDYYGDCGYYGDCYDYDDDDCYDDNGYRKYCDDCGNVINFDDYDDDYYDDDGFYYRAPKRRTTKRRKSPQQKRKCLTPKKRR